MQAKRFFHAFIIPAICFGFFMGGPSGLYAEYIDINIDEIMFEANSSNDPALQDLNPRVRMSFDSASKLLTVVLSNEACYEGEKDAGHLLTGLGFNLPSGVDIEDTAQRDSMVRLFAGSVIIDPKHDPDGSGGIQLIQDNWGYANGVRGHFVDTAQLDTNTSLSCMNSDAEYTFDGNEADNHNMDAGDYGLQGKASTPGHSVWRSIRNAVEFDLYLDGPGGTGWAGLLSYIEDKPVVVSYGSPGNSHVVPEPGVALACSVLFAALLFFRARRRTVGQA